MRSLLQWIRCAIFHRTMVYHHLEKTWFCWHKGCNVKIKEWIDHAEKIGGDPLWKKMRMKKNLLKLFVIISVVMLAPPLLATILWLFVGGSFPLHIPAALILSAVGAATSLISFGLAVEVTDGF